MFLYPHIERCSLWMCFFDSAVGHLSKRWLLLHAGGNRCNIIDSVLRRIQLRARLGLCFLALSLYITFKTVKKNDFSIVERAPGFHPYHCENNILNVLRLALCWIIWMKTERESSGMDSYKNIFYCKLFWKNDVLVWSNYIWYSETFP